MSVDVGAEMVNSGGGGPPFPGTGASELTNLNCDMVVMLSIARRPRKGGSGVDVSAKW